MKKVNGVIEGWNHSAETILTDISAAFAPI